MGVLGEGLGEVLVVSNGGFGSSGGNVVGGSVNK